MRNRLRRRRLKVRTNSPSTQVYKTENLFKICCIIIATANQTRIPIFHNNGKPFERIRAQVFIEKPVTPIDSFIGHGYSIQLNTSNPLVELNPQTNTWVPYNSHDYSDMLAFQQNVLQIGQNGSNNDILYWNRNAIINLHNANGVEFGFTVMPDAIWQAYQHFGEKEMQCVQLDVDLTGMSIKLFDYYLKVIYDAKLLPQRINPNTIPTSWMDTPITPWTFFQLRIVGFGDCSDAIFPPETSFGVNIECDTDFQFNLIDSAKSFQENWDLFTIGGVENHTLYTCEGSNLTCSLLDNGWRAKQLFYRLTPR